MTDEFGAGDRWLLIVDLPTRAEQVVSDPEYAWPSDMATKIVTYITRSWSLLPEEISSYVRWTDTRVEAAADLLDQLAEPLSYIMFHTIPHRVHITQVGRSDGTWDTWPPHPVSEVREDVCPYDCDYCHSEDCPCDRLGCAGYESRQEKIPHPTGDDGGDGMLWDDAGSYPPIPPPA